MGAFHRIDPRDDATNRYPRHTSSNLQDLVDQYQHQPELLKMILQSKLEEDRRKTEEARTRMKELEYYMSMQHKSPPSSPPPLIRSPSKSPIMRHRRSMQPITKIIETQEKDYKDAYLWKNNGNTTQRKTGWKSTYFKCANKGCPVNKTVHVSTQGHTVIKYRGYHSCEQVERICDL